MPTPHAALFASLRLIAPTFAIATLLASSAAAQSDDGDSAAAITATGAPLYETACATCHGSDGRGRSESLVGFDVPLPNFTDCDFATREPDLDWIAIVHDGGPVRGFQRTMPAFGETLTDAQIESLVRHLRGFCKNPDWPRGDLNLPLAFFTEKAYPEDEALVETTIAENGDAWTHKFIWEQRFGRRNQMELSIPVTRADLGGSDGWTTGTGDIAVAVKHVVRHNFERGSILSVAGEVSLPTGDESKGFGSAHSVFESYVSYGKVIGTASFLQVQGIVEMPTGAGSDNELVARAALGKTWTAGGPFGRAWTPMIEVLGAQPMTGGAESEWDVVPQFQVSLSRRQHILANVGVRIPTTQTSERDAEFVFYLLWDWYDGGILEGW